MVHELFKILVVEYKLVDYQYFMDTMQEWELDHFLSSLQYADRNLWESSRFTSYIIAQINSKKQLRPTDIMKFTWDKQEKQLDLNNKKEIEAFKAKMKDFEEMIKNT